LYLLQNGIQIILSIWIFAPDVLWLRKYFLPTHFVNPARDYYICKPIAGLLITSVNFFQDGSFLYWASVPGWPNKNGLPAQSPVRRYLQAWHNITET
jgi:hypothetical protein